MANPLTEKTRVPQDAPDEVKGKTAPEPTPGYKIAELRDGIAIVEADDGRMFPAEIKDGLELHKRGKVELSFDELDKDGVPSGDVTVIKAL